MKGKKIMSENKTEYKIRNPKQKRSEDTKNKLKSAGKKLFSEKGYYNTSSNEIVKIAEVSIGTFYNYYNDKKELFIEILNDYCRNIIGNIKINFIESKNDIKSLIEGYIVKVMHAHDASVEFHSEMMSLIYTDSQIRTVMNGYEKSVMESIEKMLIINKEHLKVTDFKSASFIIYKMVEEVIHSIKIFNTEYDHTSLLKELTDMICSYLT